MEKEKRKSVIILHHAHMPKNVIMRTPNVDRKTVYNVIKAYEAEGEEKAVERKSRGARSDKVLTEAFLKGIKVDADSTISMAKVARDKKVSSRTTRRAVKMCGLKSRVRPRSQLLTKNHSHVRQHGQDCVAAGLGTRARQQEDPDLAGKKT